MSRTFAAMQVNGPLHPYWLRQRHRTSDRPAAGVGGLALEIALVAGSRRWLTSTSRRPQGSYPSRLALAPARAGAPVAAQPSRSPGSAHRWAGVARSSSGRRDRRAPDLEGECGCYGITTRRRKLPKRAPNLNLQLSGANGRTRGLRTEARRSNRGERQRNVGTSDA
jgi:hypothetical protein